MARRKRKPGPTQFEKGYPQPGGIMKDLVAYGMSIAPHPDPDVALVGAIGLMSALAGRGYLYQGSTLNTYQALLAPSSYGKSAAGGLVTHALLDLEVPMGLDKKHRTTLPRATDFVKRQALSVHILFRTLLPMQQSFIWLIDEMGHLGHNSVADAEKPLQGTLLELWSTHLCGGFVLPGNGKMGTGKNQSQEVPKVVYPAFSIIGNAVETEFFKKLTQSSFEGGMFGRYLFTVIRRPKPEKQTVLSTHLPSVLRQRVMALAKTAQLTVGPGKAMDVTNIKNLEETKEARILLKAFDDECTRQANLHQATREQDRIPTNALWGRLSHKAIKLAGLHAVGRAAETTKLEERIPLVDMEDAEWAVAYVLHEIAMLGEIAKSHIAYLAPDRHAIRKASIMAAVHYVYDRFDQTGEMTTKWKLTLPYMEQRQAILGSTIANAVTHRHGFSNRELTLTANVLGHSDLVNKLLAELVVEKQLASEPHHRGALYWLPERYVPARKAEKAELRAV